jgi:hypothetical protein
VTFDGPLNLTAYDTSVDLASGTTVIGSSGSGPGTINVTGEYATLNFDNTQTVSNTTINLGGESGSTYSYSYLSEEDTSGSGNQVLTLASSVTVDVKGVAPGGTSYRGFITGDEVVNQGAIEVTGSSGSLWIDPNVFTNSGTIDVANGDGVWIEPETFTTTASSVITIGPNSSLTIDPTNAWTNLGSITLASGASLVLYGTMSAASLGSITNSDGAVDIVGTYNNSGQTLNGSASFGELTLSGGTISGGTATSAGVAFGGGTLSGVTFDGPLNLTADEAGVSLVNGTTVVGSSGSGPGTINVTGHYSLLSFDNTQTVSNETINLGNVSGGAGLYEYDMTGVGDQVLTLAATVSVDVSGYAYIQSSGYRGDGIVNDGAIDVTGSGGDFTIDARITNNGAIDVANGDSVTIYHAVTGTRTDTISGDSTLEFDARVSSAKTLGHQDIDFTGGGTLDLLAPTSFYGEISDFAAGDKVELQGTWDFSAISQAAGITTLTLVSGSTTHGFEFVGDYGESNFSITSGTTTKIAYV